MSAICYGPHLLRPHNFPIPEVSTKAKDYLLRNPGFKIIDGANMIKARMFRTHGRNAQLHPQDFDVLTDYMSKSRSVLVMNSNIILRNKITPFLQSLLDQGRLFTVDCSRGNNMADDKFAIGLAVCYHGYIHSNDNFAEFLHIPTLAERRLGPLCLHAAVIHPRHAIEVVDEDGFTLVVR
jgi:hypothetical protein